MFKIIFDVMENNEKKKKKKDKSSVKSLCHQASKTIPILPKNLNMKFPLQKT